MAKIVILDTETTGLRPGLHSLWEVSVISRDPDHNNGQDVEYCWQIRPNLVWADLRALTVSQFWTRCDITDEPEGTIRITTHPDPAVVGDTLPPDRAGSVANELAHLLADAVVVGSNPTFDRAFLAPWLAAHGQVWAAHYRPVDVITLAAGWLRAHDRAELAALDYTRPTPPYKAHDLSRAVGVDPDAYPRHTALGDCRWVRDLWDAIHQSGGGPR